MIEPFANNEQSMQIGGIIAENQQNKISIYGDIDIYLDTQGLADIQQLHELTGKILQVLTNMTDLPSADSDDSARQQELQKRANSDEIDNPFL